MDVEVQSHEQPDRLAEPVDQENRPRLTFPVIGLGASAGGLEAFGEFLSRLRADSVMELKPDHIYVIRPGNTLLLSEGKLRLGEAVDKPGHNRPVDDFFRSLAHEQRERAVAIILSGMGSNGTLGAAAVKAAGGCASRRSPSRRSSHRCRAA